MKTATAKDTPKGRTHAWGKGSESSRWRAGFLLAVGACLWLVIGERSEAQVAPVVPFTASETKEEGKKKGEWKVKTEVKNNTTKDETLVWWSWPAEKGGAKIGDLTWYPPGTVPEDPDPLKPGHEKRPKTSSGTTNPGKTVPKGGTESGETTKKKEPHSIYVRIFKKNADGTWKQENVIAHNVHLAAFHVPTTDPPSEYVSIPIRIPYPTDLADMTGHQPAEFFVTDVNLPSAWNVAFLAPAIGERFELLPHQREFTGILVARQTREMAEGERAFLEVTWHAEGPGVESYEKTIQNVVVKDATPPNVTLQSKETSEGVFVTINVQDAGGIHHAVHLTATREGAKGKTSETLVVPRVNVLDEDSQSEIGVTEAEYEITVRAPSESEMLQLEASARDQFGNTATSNIAETFGLQHPKIDGGQ